MLPGVKVATGVVWMAVGLLLWVGGLIAGKPLYLRGTGIPWGLVVAGAGAAAVAIAAMRARRLRKAARNPER